MKKSIGGVTAQAASWHERSGVLRQTVRVKGGATATVEFAFTE